jgi:C4-dicarboxylate-specific signal transduction histidine kinase
MEMDAVIAARPLAVLSKRRLLSFSVVAMSCGLTAMCSLLFHGTVRPEMMATGFIAAVIINHVITRVTRQYRQQLRDAHATLEQRVRERTAELEQANRALRDAIATQHALRGELAIRDRMATAGMVAAGVSHEIRSPLGVIKIAVDEVQDMLAESNASEARELVGDIREAADRIATILEDLSSIARPVDDPLGAVDLGATIGSAARLASYRFGNGVALERGPCDVPKVHGNASRLVQVITNLLHNAARAKRPDAPNSIRIGARTEDEHVILEVADTGTGMTPETKARLFEPFFTTGQSTGGTGLGLTICRSIVERMGGSIAIASEHGRGTTVTVTLRRAA